MQFWLHEFRVCRELVRPNVLMRAREDARVHNMP